MFYLGCPQYDDATNLAKVFRRGKARTISNRRGAIVRRYEEYVARAPLLSGLPRFPVNQEAAALLRSLFDRTEPRRSLWPLRSLLMGRTRTCPQCRISEAFELDHFLPKESYPEFSIYSQNLVPSCGRCNSLKGADDSARYLHAYYDEVPRRRFLNASVQLRPGNVWVSFTVDVTKIDAPLAEKIANQFTKLQLGERYSMQASEKLSSYAPSLERTFAAAGVAGVKADLRALLRTTMNNGVNYWEVVFLIALLTAQDYLNGGFRGL